VSPTRAPNLASRVMKLCLQRLSRDWQAVYGHEVLLAESFVDSQLFRGTSYKASGWTLLGQTRGYGRSRQDYYVAHERPKPLWVRELKAGPRTILRGRNLPAALHRMAGQFAGGDDGGRDDPPGDDEPGDRVGEALRQQAASDAARFLRCDVGRKRPESLHACNRLQTLLVAPMRNPR
jgi:hypothetical protein